jgi:hypothetical protein
MVPAQSQSLKSTSELVDSLLLPDQLPESHMLTRENIQGSLPSGQIKRTRFGKTGHESKQQSGALNSTILMPGGSPSTVVDPLTSAAVRLSSRGTLDGVTPPMDKVIDLARKTVESNAVRATSSRSLEHAELNHRDTDSAKRLERGGQSSTIDVVAPTDPFLQQELLVTRTELLQLLVRWILTTFRTYYRSSIGPPGKQSLEYRLTMVMLLGMKKCDIVMYLLPRLSRMVLRHIDLSLLYRVQIISRPEAHTWGPLRRLNHRIFGPSQAIFAKNKLLHSSWERMVVV